MLRPHGYVRLGEGWWGERAIEEDTVKCHHHQAIGFVQPGGQVLWPTLRETYRLGRPMPQEQYTCRLCYEPICPRCANKPCRHFEKWLEKVERFSGAIRSRLDRMAEKARRIEA